MSPSFGTAIHLIITYRYGILIPLSIIEGPITAFIAAALASAGYFNIWVLAAIFVVRDLGMDGVYWTVGRYGWQNRSVERLLAKIHVHEEQLDGVKALWERHQFRTILVGKLAYGLATSFIMVAGMVKIPLLKFYKYSVWVTAIQFGALLFFGYFFGDALGEGLVGTVEHIQIAIGGIAVAIVIWYILGRHMRERFIHAHEEAGLHRPKSA